MTPLKTMLPVLGLALLIGAGASAPALAATAAGNAHDPYIIAFDQKVEQSVTVAFARLPQDGYVAIYSSDGNGKPTGPALGYAPLKAGDHRAVDVTLEKALEPGKQVWIALYQDADKKPSFEPGSGDNAYWSKDAIPPANMIMTK